MSKYLKNFEGHNDYDSYINNNPNLPNVSCCTTPYHVHYNPLPYPHMDVKIKKITDKTIYGLGDTIENRIFIYNDGNKDIINLEVKTDDGTLISQKTIDLIPTGCYFVLEAAKTVTEEMILSGDTTTYYTIDGVTYEDEPVTAEGDSSSSIGKPNGHLSVYKVTTSAPANGHYALGETIKYKVTVRNDGNLTITDITVKDELTEDRWTIDSLVPGDSREFEPAPYVVTENDIIEGEVVNVATATGTSPDHEKPDVAVTPGEDPESTESQKPSLEVNVETTSEPANGESYAFGETIEYKITITNNGNLTITDITLEGGKDYSMPSSISLPQTMLGIGESMTATYSVIVTTQDVTNGYVKFYATADGYNGGNEPTDPGTDEAEDSTYTPIVPGE